VKERNLKDMWRSAERAEPISVETALEMLGCGAEEIPELLACATRAKRRNFGAGYSLCSIMNAKSGACTEDCAFCAQSVHHRSEIEISGLASPGEVVQAYEGACLLPVRHFGIVTSGMALEEEDVRRLCEAPAMRTKQGVSWCASLGCLDEPRLTLLKNAGFKRFHHNLETSGSFFPNICSTHSYDRRIETLRAAKDAGLEACSGGILGLGESPEQRVELAATLLREDVDSIPLNFLVPLSGTRLEGATPLKPLDIIRSIAMFRMMNPRAEIKVCAGRVHLRDLQSMIFYAGATGFMIGPLLTIDGRGVENDLRMLDDLEIRGAGLHECH